MANTINEAIETKDISVVNTVSSNDYVVVTANVSGNARTRNIRVKDLFANTDHDVKAANLIITLHTTPASNTANCILGQVWFDNNYAYFAIANNMIKRIAIEDF